MYRRVVNTGQRWHLPALPTTLARLLLRSQASHKEKRPHTTSTQPLSLHLGYRWGEIQEHLMPMWRQRSSFRSAWRNSRPQRTHTTQAGVAEPSGASSTRFRSVQMARSWRRPIRVITGLINLSPPCGSRSHVHRILVPPATGSKFQIPSDIHTRNESRLDGTPPLSSAFWQG